MNSKTLVSLALLTSTLSIAGCGSGGGGGGGDFIGAAEVSLSASPTQIDTADRTKITVRISNVDENGIALKLRYPTGLSYVPDSSEITVNDTSTDISPDVLVSDGNDKYLVYYLTRAKFKDDNQGEVSFFLVGDEEVSEGKIEVDADIDDPLKDNATEFDVQNPNFQEEDSVQIDVAN